MRARRQQACPFALHSRDQTGFQTLSKSIPLNFSDASRFSLAPSPQKSLHPLRLSLSGMENKSFAVFLHQPPPLLTRARRQPSCLRPRAMLPRWFSGTNRIHFSVYSDGHVSHYTCFFFVFFSNQWWHVRHNLVPN